MNKIAGQHPRFVAVVAARMGSSRLPGKVLLPIGGKPAVLFLLDRLLRSQLLDEIILATSDLPQDDVLAATVMAAGYRVFRGSEEDVLGRTAAALRSCQASHFVRITGDCPFVGGRSLDSVLQRAIDDLDFDLMTTKPLFPRGIDYEIAPVELILSQDELDLSDGQREHLFNYTLEHSGDYRIRSLSRPEFLMPYHETYLLDNAEDYQKLTDFPGKWQDPEGPSLWLKLA